MSELPEHAGEYDGYGMPTSEALIYGADKLVELGGRSLWAAAPYMHFRDMLASHRPGDANGWPSFPSPGMYLQARCGWFHVVADDRLTTNVVVRDVVTGQSVLVRLNT